MRRTDIQRFEKLYIPEPNTGCWFWIGHLGINGYGMFWHTEKAKCVKAHRWSYEHHKGPIPAGLVIDHMCEQKTCVNPDHLQAITSIENSRYGGFGLFFKRQCAHGHEFDMGNTHIDKDGHWKCISCRKNQSRKRTEKRELEIYAELKEKYG